MKIKYTKEEAEHFVKSDTTMWKYAGKEECKEAGVLYQEVNGGHYIEFINHKSTFIYYIIEGEGKFIIEDIEYPVKATDVIIVPSNTRFYYVGKMKQVLINTPAWEASAEEELRVIPH